MSFRLTSLAVAVLLSATPANAAVRGGLSTGGIVANAALSGIVGFNAANFPFVNYLKMANLNAAITATTFVYPGYLQAGSDLPTGALPGQLNYSAQIPSNYFGEYVLANQGTISGTSESFASPGPPPVNSSWGQVYSIGAGTTISGCSNSNVPPCYFGNGLNVGGTNPTVTFDLSFPITNVTNNGSGAVRITYPGQPTYLANGITVTVKNVVGSDGNGCGANITASLANVTSTTADLVGSTFTGGCTYASGGQFWGQQSGISTGLPFDFNAGTYTSLTSVVLCKLADYQADPTCNTTAGHTAWTGGFNDDFVTALAKTQVHHFRMLDVNNLVFGIPPDWANWPSTSLFSYSATYYAIPNWFGSASGTNSYAISCANGQACTYTLTGGAPKNGDYFQFYVPNANTSPNPTLTITDANSVTSSAIPIIEQGLRESFTMGGSATSGNTVAMQFNSSCLSGGTHTTAAYTVTGTDTLNSIGAQLVGIINADTTLTSQPIVVVATNPLGGPVFFFGYASNACAVTASLVVGGTGSPTETASIGPIPTGNGLNIQPETFYTGIYSSLHNAIVLNVNDATSSGSRSGWPWSIQIALSKAVSTKLGKQVGCWLQPNFMWSDASLTSLVNYANANQCPGATVLENCNEIWLPGNNCTAMATGLAASIGLGGDFVAYGLLRDRQWWAIASSSFGGLSGNLVTSAMFQLGAITTAELDGTTLCGTSCSNTAYQNAIGVNYNASPNRPIDYIRVVGQAPYYTGGLMNNQYQSPSSYGSWSAITSSVTSNVLTVSGTVTGTIFWNQGVAGCDGVYLAPPNLNNPTSFQITGSVSKTANGSFGSYAGTYTLNNTTSLQTGMWMFDQNTGAMLGIIGSINSGANQITLASAPLGFAYSYPVASGDTIIFGGKAGTYQLNSTTCSIASGTITGGDLLGMKYAADNYSGISGALGSQQDAFNWMYLDTLNGTIAGQQFTVTAIQTLTQQWLTIANVANGFSVKVWDYEGGYNTNSISASTASNLGFSSSYGYSTSLQNDGYLNILLNAWKNSSSFKAVETARHNNELASLPTGSMTMWFNFDGALPGGSYGQFELYPQDLYAPPPFQSYNAICDYNGGSC